MGTNHRLALAAGLLLLLSACSDDEMPMGPDPTFPITFQEDIQPIFTARCAVSSCHTGPSPKADCNLSSGNSYANLVNVPATNFGPGIRVIPSDSAESILYQLVLSGTMPQTGGKLTANQIEAIRVWIDDGAVND